MILRETINRVRSTVAECSDEDLEREFDGFFAGQSEICDFVMDVTSRSRQTVRELTLYLSYVVYKTLLVEGNVPAGAVSADVIAGACRESEEWIQRLGQIEGAAAESALPAAAGDEPYLLGFVIAEVEDAVRDGLDLRDEERGIVFFALKTVIASLTQAGTSE